MTAPTGLGQYVPPAASQGDRIQAQQMVDKPILVWVRKTQHLARTKFSAEGGDAVYLDFIDLQTNQCYIEVMWMAGAIVDGLKQYAGDGNAYPVKVVRVQGGQHGFYQRIESLGDDPQWMNHVLANLPAFQHLIATARAQKEAEWATAMQQANQPPAPPQMPGALPPAPALAPAGAGVPPFQQPGQQAQYGAPQQMPAAGAGQFGPPANGATPPPSGGVPVAPAFQQPAAAAPQQQILAGPPPQYQQQAQPQYGVQQQPAAPSAQPGYQPQQYAPPGQQPQAAVAPPQYQQVPAAPPGPPVAAPPQQFQQAGPPAAPVQQFAPQGLPTPPGAVTGQSVAELQEALRQIG